jgi:dienelactone hydrolase
VYKALFALTLFPYLVACINTHSINERHEIVQAIVSQTDLKPERITAGDFLLTTYHRGLNIADKNLMIYIEGDGSAWDKKYRLSKNPTPNNPLALKLAAKDSADSILYIARPCMYLDQEQLQDCPEKFWSSHRYSEKVISSINQVINSAVGLSSTKSLTLVGYSGGGTIAALITARRHDVSSLVTIASNLDHKFWTELHGISPLTGSLDPLEYVNGLSMIEQTHFVGAKDKIVPNTVIESYLSKLSLRDKITINIIKDFNHSCCWEKAWPDLLNATNANQ